MMRKLLQAAILLAAVCFFTETALAASAEERKPLRVAVLPVYDETGSMTGEGLAKLQERLMRELHVPLNDTLKAVYYVPEEESQEALTALWKGRTGKVRHPESDMKPLADKLSADLVVLLDVTQYYERTYLNYWDDELCLECYAGLRIVGYDRRNDRVLSENASRWYNDSYNSFSTCDSLLMDGLDSMLQKLRLRTAIYPLVPVKANEAVTAVSGH